MPALATFGRAPPWKIAKVIKRVRYKSDGKVRRAIWIARLLAFSGWMVEEGRKSARDRTGAAACRAPRVSVCLVSLYRRATDSRFLKNAQTCQRVFSHPRSCTSVTPPPLSPLSEARTTGRDTLYLSRPFHLFRIFNSYHRFSNYGKRENISKRVRQRMIDAK